MTAKRAPSQSHLAQDVVRDVEPSWPPTWAKPGTLDLVETLAELTDHLKQTIAVVSTLRAALDETTPSQSHAGSRGDMTGQT